jgi:tungstate transport system ATP-binding protein
MIKEILNCQGIKVFRQNRPVLDIDQLAVHTGELIAVLGPNGSGKSTLLKVINAILPHKSGTVYIFGEDLQSTDTRELRLRCSFVFQDPMLLTDTVYNNVALPLRFHGIPEDGIERKVHEVLADFRCTHLAKRLAGQLSGGEAQRVCLARALVTEPELLLLDEPFAALDPSTRLAMLSELRQMAVQRKMTVLLVSHHFSEVLEFAERAIVLEDGRLVQDDRPEVILRRPANETVARLIGMDNIFTCQIEATDTGNLLRLPNGVTLPWQGSSTGQRLCCLPGDALDIHCKVVTDDQQLLLKGIILQITPGVGVYRAVVDCQGFLLVARLPRERAGNLTAGEAVQVLFDPQELHLLE